MNIVQLRNAQVSFENRMEEVIQAREPLHHFRETFVRHFTIARINEMRIEEYALGYSKRSTDFNFCYGIERQLDGLGKILGANASKFGIYFSKDQQQLVVTKRWGDTAAVAFRNIRQALIDLIRAGERNDFTTIASNPHSPMFKGKILATYFPDRYLNVFSKDHLNYFLIHFNLDTTQLIEGDEIYKKEALINFKNTDPVMRNWSLDIFSYFLYRDYPGRPPRKDQSENDLLSGYRPPNFPPAPSPLLVELNILPPVGYQSNTGRGRGSRNPDYGEEERNQRELGDRGEKIVLDMEKRRLLEAGKQRLSSSVKKADFDYDGYDILSFEEDGTPRHIEVKATRARVGQANFFLTSNEFNTAKTLDNYHVYLVFEILSSTPKIWRIGNPFSPENTNVIKMPILYRVSINAGRL
jgi:hypothetical protein